MKNNTEADLKVEEADGTMTVVEEKIKITIKTEVKHKLMDLEKWEVVVITVLKEIKRAKTKVVLVIVLNQVLLFSIHLKN